MTPRMIAAFEQGRLRVSILHEKTSWHAALPVRRTRWDNAPSECEIDQSLPHPNDIPGIRCQLANPQIVTQAFAH